MKAAVIHAYGGPEVISIEDVPTPSIAEDEVLIRVAASSFNPADAAIRAGYLQAVLPITFPHILGADAAGTIERVGSGVKTFKPGDRVYTYVDFVHRGGMAELVAAKASETANAPTKISLGDAATLPAVASSAWQALFDHAQLERGQRVLVAGAAGGVGSMVVQLAKWKGATVVALAAQKHDARLRELGVDERIDDLVALGAPVDAVIDASPGSSEEVTSRLAALRPGGVLVAMTNPADQATATAKQVRLVRMASQRSGEQLGRIAKLVDEGAIHPIVSERRALDEVIAVHQRGRAPYGKVAIIVDENLAK